jgi:2-haloacid dehalogenase
LSLLLRNLVALPPYNHRERTGPDVRPPEVGCWGDRRVEAWVADNWLTFDCYGTVADWNSGMSGALAELAGPEAARLLAAYHRAELEVEAGPQWRPYREVLTAGLARAAEREQITLPPGGEEAFVRAWPQMPVFADAGPALTALAERGWKLAFLTNCDDDLFETTRARMPAPFETWVTAQQVRSYKPDLAHFRTFADRTGATAANWIHVANSWVLDVMPAARMGLRSVWVDRDLTGHPAKLADRRITSMRRLPEAVSDVSAIPPR